MSYEENTAPDPLTNRKWFITLMAGTKVSKVPEFADEVPGCGRLHVGRHPPREVGATLSCPCHSMETP
jgi:hypothetical protein